MKSNIPYIRLDAPVCCGVEPAKAVRLVCKWHRNTSHNELGDSAQAIVTLSRPRVQSVESGCKGYLFITHSFFRTAKAPKPIIIKMGAIVKYREVPLDSKSISEFHFDAVRLEGGS